MFLIFFQHFESDDPELYETKIKFIEENSVEDLELYMVEEEYDDSGHLVKVALLCIPWCLSV